MSIRSVRPIRWVVIVIVALFIAHVIIGCLEWSHSIHTYFWRTGTESKLTKLQRKIHETETNVVRFAESVGPSVFIPTSQWGARLVAQPISKTTEVTFSDKESVEFPMLHSDYRVDIRGDVATVRVRQTFKNTGSLPVNAVYEFPLHEESAVFAMTMRSGKQRIRAQIERKEEAETIFEQAKNKGKTAALLTQQRPNLFNQTIANLMPGHPVEVELHYVQALEKTDGRYHLDLPLVAGPRYQPADRSKNYLVALPDGSDDAFAYQSPLPRAIMELPIPATIDSDRVSIEVRIDGGVPVHSIESPSHRIFTTQLAANTWEAQLDEGREIPNKEFSLSYKLGGEKTNAGLVSYYNKDAQEGYFALLIEPPATLIAEEILPREMVFVIDASGSMDGAPMEANKAYMRHTLQNLRPDDTFRIIEFSQAAHEYLEIPTLATPENIAEALAYVESLEAGGGSNIEEALDRALTPQVASGHLRLVTFLTDGYVSNEFETLRTLKRKRGESRLFAIGVGGNVNRYLLGEMGEIGKGFAAYVDPSGDIQSQAIGIAERLQSPVLRNIHVDWGGFLPAGARSSKIPDLFVGQSVRLLGTFKKPGTYNIVVHGDSGRGPVSFPQKITVPEDATAGKAVELAWARSAIDDYMKELLTPEELREDKRSDVEIQRLVTRLSLEHSLVSQWTSFVAVSEEVVNPQGGAEYTWATASREVVAPTQRAPRRYSSSDDASNREVQYVWRGSNTPEPATWAGLLLAALAVLFAMWRPRRREELLR